MEQDKGIQVLAVMVVTINVNFFRVVIAVIVVMVGGVKSLQIKRSDNGRGSNAQKYDFKQGIKTLIVSNYEIRCKYGQRWYSQRRRKVRCRPKTKAPADRVIVDEAAVAIETQDPPVFEGEDVHPVKEYLKAKQKAGKNFCETEVYEET